MHFPANECYLHAGKLLKGLMLYYARNLGYIINMKNRFKSQLYKFGGLRIDKGSCAMKCVIVYNNDTILSTVINEISHESSYFSLCYGVSYIIFRLELWKLKV